MLLNLVARESPSALLSPASAALVLGPKNHPLSAAQSMSSRATGEVRIESSPGQSGNKCVRESPVESLLYTNALGGILLVGTRPGRPFGSAGPRL